MKLGLDFGFNFEKNLDGLWCRIFCVLARRCICYTVYQGPRLSNFPSRVQMSQSFFYFLSALLS